MIKQILFLSVCIMLLGCATVSDYSLSKKFDKVADSYRSALSWEDFEQAKSFLSEQSLKKESTSPTDELLKKVKVTSYKVQNIKMNNEERTIEQAVEIKYYNTDYLVEKVIQDNQIWIYESNSWYLSTGLPVFE